MPHVRVSRFPGAGRLLLAFVAITALGACGGGKSTSPPTSQSSSVAGLTPAGPAANGSSGTPACAVAPAAFTSTVWPELSSSCVACHSAGNVASGTRLVFNAAGDAQQNYTILRTFVGITGDLVLTKSIGQQNHGGGAPYGDATSQSYRDLQSVMPSLQQSCGGSAGVQATGFWSGVHFASSSTALARAAILFAGRNPTASEVAAASADSTTLRQTIRGYMQGPAFDNFLNEAGMTQFLTLRVSPRGTNGLDPTDFPALANIAAADMGRFDSAIQREPIELMKFIVKGDLPWTDMVQGHYTVSNGIMAQYLGASVQGAFTNPQDDNEWRQATIPALIGGVREHSGVLSSHAWLASFPTTATNRNRHRIYILANQFLATDVAALAVRPIGGPGNFIIPTVENPGCAACHDTIDPMAAGFQNWAENNRYLPYLSNAGKHISLPYSYRSSSYPKNAQGNSFYTEGDNWFRDEKAPGYSGLAMPGGVTGNNTALQWLGQQVAADSRFGIGAVEFWYQAVFGREPLRAPLDASGASGASQLAAFNAQQTEFASIAARFSAGGYKVKDLLTDLVLSQWFNAEAATGLTSSRAQDLADVGSYNLLIPSQLNLKLTSLVGQSWSSFNAPYSGLALTYGSFDGNTQTLRAKDYTMMQALTIDRFAATRSCAIAMADFNRPVSSRVLFPNVTLADTPMSNPAAITANVQYLHKWLWKQDVPATDSEVLRTVQLFTDVWNDRANAPANTVSCGYNNGNDALYTGRAWAAVLAYMLGDPQFLYE